MVALFEHIGHAQPVFAVNVPCFAHVQFRRHPAVLDTGKLGIMILQISDDVRHFLLSKPKRFRFRFGIGAVDPEYLHRVDERTLVILPTEIEPAHANAVGRDRLVMLHVVISPGAHFVRAIQIAPGVFLLDAHGDRVPYRRGYAGEPKHGRHSHAGIGAAEIFAPDTVRHAGLDGEIGILRRIDDRVGVHRMTTTVPIFDRRAAHRPLRTLAFDKQRRYFV